MSTNVSRRIAATFQGGRDPDQDQIVEWLKTLPVSTKGNVERSVMKYHITRALLAYIQSGPGLQSQSNLVRVATHAPLVSEPVIVPVVAKSTSQVVDTVKTVAVVKPATSVVLPENTVTKAKGGSLLRNKIAKSMSGA